MNTEQPLRNDPLNEREQILTKRKQLLIQREALDERQRFIDDEILIAREEINYQEKELNKREQNLIETAILDAEYVNIDEPFAKKVKISIIKEDIEMEDITEKVIEKVEELSETAKEEIRLAEPITITLLEKIFGNYIEIDKPESVDDLIELIHHDYKNIIWDEVSIDEKNINHAIMEEFAIKLNFDIISQFWTLSNTTIEKFIKYLNGNLISRYQILSDYIIKKFIHTLNKALVTQYQKLSHTSMELIFHLHEAERILFYQDVPDSLMPEILVRICWNSINYELNLSDRMIMKYFNVFDMKVISRWQKFTINSLAKIITKIEWVFACQNPSLTDEMIEKFDEFIVYSVVCQNLVLSEKSRAKYILKVTDADMQKYLDADRNAWDYLRKCPNLSREFLAINAYSYGNYRTWEAEKYDKLLNKLPEVNPLSLD